MTDAKKVLDVIGYEIEYEIKKKQYMIKIKLSVNTHLTTLIDL